MAVANALGTPTCVPTASFELLSEKQRHGHCKCDGKTTNVCAPCKLRIIRETTAWPLEMRWEHTNVCALCKLRIIIREATAWPLQMRRKHTNVCAHCKLRIIIREEGHCKCDGNTPTCVSTVSFELLSEKQRPG